MKEHLINENAAESSLLAAATFLAENIDSSDGHAEALKEIVVRYVAKGEVDFAAQLADTIKDTFVRDRLLCDIAEKCAALGDDEYALQLAAAVEDFGFQAMAREFIAAQKASKNEFDKALEITETLAHPSEALANIAVRQAQNSNESAARQTISRIEFHSSKVTALQGIAAHFQSEGNTERANDFLAEAADEARQIEFSEEKIRALLSVAAHYTEAAQFNKAIEVLDEARTIAELLGLQHRDNFLTFISLEFLRAGSIDLADLTLDLVADKTQIASCLTGFAAEFDSKGERADALETLEEAYAIWKSQKDKDVRDSRARFGVLTAISVRFAVFEKPERAIEIALESPPENERNAALAQIAQVCAAQDKAKFLRQALAAITDDSARIFALIVVADVKSKSENTSETLQFLNEAARLCEALPQPGVRSPAFNELAKRFAEQGEGEEVRAVALESLRAISRIYDESHQAILLARLSEVYETLGLELNEAEGNLLRAMLRKLQL